MQSLIIVANPRPNSFSHQLAEAYREGAILHGRSVEILDLYTTQLQLGFLKPENRSEYTQFQPIREAIQDLIKQADELIIIHPLWWGGMPAILKNMCDQVLTPGFAYQKGRRRRRKPLLKGKTARLFITCDKKWWSNLLRLLPYLNVWYFDIFRASGLKLKSFKLYSNMRDRSGLTRSKWLAKVNRLAAK